MRNLCEYSIKLIENYYFCREIIRNYYVGERNECLQIQLGR